MLNTGFIREGGRLATEEIRRDHPGTTAIVALNDAMAMGVLSALREHDIAVPGRMFVVRFDDVSVAADLTTIRLPMTDMGRMALDLALNRRRAPSGHRLVVRDSTGPASAWMGG